MSTMPKIYPNFLDIFKYFKNIARSLASVQTKYFRKHRVRLFKKRLLVKTFFGFVRPKWHIRFCRFNFFQFFFLFKHTTRLNFFFKSFEKGCPQQIMDFFIKNDYVYTNSLYKSLFFFSNIDSYKNFYLENFFQRNFLSKSNNLPYMVLMLPSCPIILSLLTRKRKLFFRNKLFFLLKRHFFFKNVSKKHSFIFIINNYFYKIFFDFSKFYLDLRVGCIIFRSILNNLRYNQHPLNWASFDQYNWKKRI